VVEIRVFLRLDGAIFRIISPLVKRGFFQRAKMLLNSLVLHYHFDMVMDDYNRSYTKQTRRH